MSSTKTPAGRNGTSAQTIIGRATTAATDVGTQVQAAATDATALAAKHAPAAAAVSRNAYERALATIRGSSTGALMLGTFFASGMTAGMVLSRAPRVLVAVALLAAMVLGGTALGRGTTLLEATPE